MSHEYWLGDPAGYGTIIRLSNGREMTITGNFIAALQAERKIGKVSSETELHLKHELRKLGWDASASTLAAAVGEEIERLDKEASTLRKLRADHARTEFARGAADPAAIKIVEVGAPLRCVGSGKEVDHHREQAT
jgi:hypothetical protein